MILLSVLFSALIFPASVDPPPAGSDATAAPQRDPAEVTGEIYWEASRLFHAQFDAEQNKSFDDAWFDVMDYPGPEPWPAELDPVVKRYLDANAACLAAIDRATDRKTCRFGETLSDGKWYLREFVQLLRYRARWHARRGEIAAAFDDLVRIYRVRDHQLLAETGLAPRFLASAFEHSASSSVRAWLPRASGERVRILVSLFDQLDELEPSFAGSLRADHVLLVEELRGEYRKLLAGRLSGLSEGSVAFCEHLMDQIVGSYDQGGRRVVEQAARRFDRLPCVEAVALLRREERLSEVSEEEYEVALSRARQLIEEAAETSDPEELDRIARNLSGVLAGPMISFLITIPAGAMPHHFEKEASNIARRRATRLAVSLELHRREHGHYPETLDALMVPDPSFRTDPFTHEPFRYRLHEEAGYQLWSVGKDGVDDRAAGHADERPNGERPDLVFDGPGRWQ